MTRAALERNSNPCAARRSHPSPIGWLEAEPHRWARAEPNADIATGRGHHRIRSRNSKPNRHCRTPIYAAAFDVISSAVSRVHDRRFHIRLEKSSSDEERPTGMLLATSYDPQSPNQNHGCKTLPPPHKLRMPRCRCDRDDLQPMPSIIRAISLSRSVYCHNESFRHGSRKIRTAVSAPAPLCTHGIGSPKTIARSPT